MQPIKKVPSRILKFAHYISLPLTVGPISRDAPALNWMQNLYFDNENKELYKKNMWGAHLRFLVLDWICDIR